MENRKSDTSKLKEYESIISSQKEHINRYESRLKDIIVAYKGLAKEKAALETTLQTLSCEGNTIAKKPSTESDGEANTIKNAAQDGTSASHQSSDDQVQKLTKNIATLTSERNRIEEVLKRERNQLRQDMAAKNATIEELTKRLKTFENHQKHRSTTQEDQSLTIRELKKMLDDERNLKEKLELQLGDLKTQFLLNLPERSEGSKRRAGMTYPSPLGDSSEADPNRGDTSVNESLLDLQQELVHLKRQYANAVADEKQRVRLAEERSQRLGEIHEERVANLESRITELSEMIGKYDRLREQDKENILQLKETIAQMKTSDGEEVTKSPSDGLYRESIEDGYGSGDHYKHHAREEVNAAPNEIFDANLLLIGTLEGDKQEKLEMQKEFENYKRGYEQCVAENQKLKEELLSIQEYNRRLLQKLDSLKQTLVYNETEFEMKLAEQTATLKTETAKHNEALCTLQASFESQIGHLQDTLQKQRERSLTVMDEKDEEIKTLRTSLEILSLSTATLRQQDHTTMPAREPQASGSVMVASFGSSPDEQQHLIHYAQEIARKNVEISALRTSKNAMDATLRQTLQEKVMIEENCKEKMSQMAREIERLRRNYQLEGSNLEYLKNVVLSFLLSRDSESKKHMTNAIAAVLKFDDSEIQAVNNVKF
ncbi:GRIP and coiled-coil domain-containing protein 1 [Anopheles ziemanni]|uniref:GRIP and coiled-coil domain-containing protein 1 n=1 Tax=Anopheles coustani TaxID=139045 RepID=UPI00265928FD|nr:GRIP and coiled-coil domain-containing protein 1 [Anopheles coustani]XP_058171008.1 GRIP and coiled-coil domain-containing protein 1 [Anopheles ziemanni]